jgi:shikimate dehydrogenase
MKFKSKIEQIKLDNSNKKICIIIGNPVEHSLSPAMHNVAYKTLGLDKKFIFDKITVPENELEEFIDDLKTFNSKEKTIVGITCTMPHKQNIIKYLDCLKNEAKIINAVNTVSFQDGNYVGYNTDWYGIERPFVERNINLKNKKVTIIGAGGASRAAIYAFIRNGCLVNILNRTIEKAESLAKEFNCSWFSLDNESIIENSDIIVNTTNVGMVDVNNLSPINTNLIKNNHIVFECIYKPKETKFLKDSQNNGAKIIYGWEMLLYQGMMQFEIYTGEKPILESMRSVL